MKIFIGDKKTRRFELALKCTNIMRDLELDNVLYIEDDNGNRYRLEFNNSKELGKLVTQLIDEKTATTHCSFRILSDDIDYGNEVYTDREREYTEDFLEDFEIER